MPAGRPTGASRSSAQHAHHRIAEENRDVCFYVESMDPNITRTANLQYTYDTYWGVIEALGRGAINPALARQRLAYIASRPGSTASST